MCGARDHTEADLAEDLADDSVFGYLADDGFVVYGWADKDIVVHQLVAASVETARALWAVVGSSSSVAEEVHAYLAPDDALHLLLGEPVFESTKQTQWMLRLLDVRLALSARGYAAGVDVDVPVVIDDPQEAANCLSGRLRVAAGKGELVESAVRTGVDAIRLGANGVAALYAGSPTAVLATAGLISGGSPEDRAFWMPRSPDDRRTCWATSDPVPHLSGWLRRKLSALSRTNQQRQASPQHRAGGVLHMRLM